VKAGFVLRGSSKRIALEWLFAQEKVLLAAAEQQEKKRLVQSQNGATAPDGSSNGGDGAGPGSSAAASGRADKGDASYRETIRDACKEIVEIEKYYDRAGNKAARLRYFGGMVLGTIVAFGLLALAALLFDASFFSVDLEDEAARNFFICYTAGALGAVISVLTRMRREKGFELDYEIGKAQTVTLGSFRPFIGAVFGLIIYFAIQSDFLQVVVPDGDPATEDPSPYFLAFLAFAAGFSERLAHVVLGGAERTIAASVPNYEQEEEASTASPDSQQVALDASVARLERLGQMWQEGKISPDEFAAYKAKELAL
jgi:hypothetical protein